MTDDLLAHIQQLQFTDRRAAEGLLVPFLRETLALDVQSVMLRPLAVSLNSFNGLATLGDGTQVFFKTHIEADGVLDEYYNANLLHNGGYKVIQPLFASRQTGRQILVYPLVTCPSVFDAAWASESAVGLVDDRLASAQAKTDDRLSAIYARTLTYQDAAQARTAPIHQLFHHRLTGGRFQRFYGTGSSFLWEGHSLPVEEAFAAHWVINGRLYDVSLNNLVATAATLLNPEQAGPAIIGHGDAHNGNVFYCADESELTYFDPAFAGIHHPLLDLTKPLYHNAFAMWMYHPAWFDERIRLELRRDGGVWHINHNYELPQIRHMFLNSKVDRVLRPTLALLDEHGWLRPDWRAFLKAALMCCPLLTMNLTDAQRFPPQIALLGLAHAIEMGATAQGAQSIIDDALSRAELGLG